MAKTIRTAPAILSDDPQAFSRMVMQAGQFTDFAQFDIMDGIFVPSKSITCSDVTAIKTSLRWEVHLMVVNPENCLAGFRDAGAFKAVFHYEAVPDPGTTIELIHHLGMKAGMAVNPGTTNDAIAPFVDRLDSVLFMSVNPGYYGAPFIPEVLDKVRDFRRSFPDIEIGMDGGVNEKTIPDIVTSGTDVIYIGSAVFRQPDPGEAFRRLTALANNSAGG